MLATANRLLDREDTLDEVIASYLHATDAGEPPNRLELLARHGEIASDLAEFFLAQDRLETLTSPLRACTQPDGLPVPHRLGDFKLIREIGRGGMGIVHEAEQISLKRRVALKILPFASTLDSRHLQRFKNEAVASATLHHTNIVPVFATGCEQGVHFYAMQLIEGKSLAELICDLRLRIGDCNSITNRQSQITNKQVAELGIQAAEALEHAHQAGIIHRDIKPANILIDQSPIANHQSQIRLTDFGLAHFQSDAQLTMTGDFLGTLRYVSPEQALTQRGIVDHRTDVYSLGVTLYELLTLQPAFDGKDRREILRQIACEEPRSLRKIDRSIPRELETIVLKAMAKDSAHRYATAKELAADLRRFVLHEPIKARRPGVVQKVRMWGRRHPGVVGSAAVVLVLVTVASVISTVLVSQAKHEQGLALQEKIAALEVVKKERERAEGAEQKAAVEAAITIEVNEFLQRDLLGQVHTAPEEVLFASNRNLTVREALRRAADRIGNRFQDKPLVEAAIRSAIGNAYGSLFEHQLAEPHRQRALEIRQIHIGPHHPTTITNMESLATSYQWTGRIPDAITLYKQVLASKQERIGADNPETLRCLRKLASVYLMQGQYDVSVSILEKLLVRQQAVCGVSNGDTLETMAQLAFAYEEAGRLEVALATYERIVALNSKSHATISIPYAHACQCAGRFADAERILRERLERLTNRDDSTGRIQRAAVLGWLGRTLLFQERYSEAEVVAREAVTYFEQELPNDYKRFYWVSLLGGAILGQGKCTEAEAYLLQGYEGMKERERIMPHFWRRRIAEPCERIVRLYEDLGHQENVDFWSNRLLAELQE